MDLWSAVWLEVSLKVIGARWPSPLERTDECSWPTAAVTGAKRPQSPKGRNVFLPSHGHIPIETNMRQGEKVMKRKPVFQARLLKKGSSLLMTLWHFILEFHSGGSWILEVQDFKILYIETIDKTVKLSKTCWRGSSQLKKFDIFWAYYMNFFL